jgi:uncharacterized protein YdeI (YjbR/CyaY-like superfamily)
LREIVLDCSFTEELKWGVPCYTIDGRNVVLIHGFKEYCALLFFKGALLRDPQGILIRQTVNVQASRQIRFTGVQEITELKPILKDYLLEAIVVEKAGLDVEWNETSEFSIPEELQQKFDEISGLKDAFEALTPGRQRAYLLYFSEAKQAKTRVARVEKYLPAIFSGKGLHD